MPKMRPESGLFKLSKTILTDPCKVEEKPIKGTPKWLCPLRTTDYVGLFTWT